MLLLNSVVKQPVSYTHLDVYKRQTVHHDIREAVADADVVNVLRIQLERIHSALYPTNREYARIFGINNDVLKLAKDDVMVMHPGPMNRGLEIAPDVAYSDQSVIQEQVRNGVAVRMAVLYLTTVSYTHL